MSPWLWRGRLAGGCLAGGRVPSSLSYFPSLVSFALHEMHISTQCYVRPSPCCATIGSHSEVQRVLTSLGTLLYEAHLGQVHYVKEVFKRWQFVSNSLCKESAGRLWPCRKISFVRIFTEQQVHNEVVWSGSNSEIQLLSSPKCLTLGNSITHLPT